MTNFGKTVVGFFVAGLLILGVSFYFLDFTDGEEGDFDNAREKIVYETEVDGPQDCSSFETYDAENMLCTFECESEAQCSQIEQQIEEELASWTEELADDKEPVAEKNFSKNADAQASYKVTSGEKISLADGKDSDENRKIWQDIAALSPDNISDKYIETYEIFNSPNDDTLAFVDDEDGNGKWRVAVNLPLHKSSTEREQKATLIHELGHIITLNSAQVNAQISEESCTNFFIDEGCANANSYINNFKNKFWKGVSQQEFDENKFVTEYATSNEVEDLAESFAFFVLGKKENGDNEKQQKINFYYSYPDLVTVREAMRASLSKDIVRAKKVGGEN
jgi:hypothetical protein